jgi:curved DNA-binding protein CbpA
VTDADASRELARDLYQLLGVARDASRQEIALAWRRRARDEHPDARRDDDGAPARFRALAEAWQVLGDPGRRAAYDRGLDPGQPPGRVRVTVRHPPAAPGPGQVPRAAGWDEEDLRLALLAELVLRYRGRGRPW